MPDKLFQSSKLKVERAKSHINELESIIQNYVSSEFYKLVIEPDANGGGTKVSFKTLLDPPTGLNMVFGDVVSNLRAALEHLAYAVVADSNGDKGNSYFPIHDERHGVKNAVKNGVIADAGPEIADLILSTIKPYKAGNPHLWALHKLCNIDKHRMLISVTTLRGVTCSIRVGNTVLTNNNFSTSGGDDFVIFGTNGDVELTDDSRGTFRVEIGEIDILKGEPLIPTLYSICDSVLDAVEGFDATYVRRT